MGLNVAGNALFLVVVFFTFLGFIIGFTILNPLNASVSPILVSIGVNPADYSFMSQYATYKTYILQSFQFMLYFIVGLVIFSSFFNSNSFKDYVIGAIVGTIISVILSYLVTMSWNYFTTLAPYLDFSDFPTSELWFITNIQAIFIVNLVASLTSFIFVKQNKESTVTVV